MRRKWPKNFKTSPISPDTRMAILSPETLKHANTIPLCKMLSVTHIGRFERLKGHMTTRPRGAEQHILLLCFDGEGKLETKHGRWTLGRGDLVHLFPGEAHHYEADNRNPWSHCWFHFTGSHANQYAGILNTSPLNPVFRVGDVDRLLEVFEDSFRYVLGGYTDTDLIGLSSSCIYFLGLCRTLQKIACSKQRLGEERILKSIRFMRENKHRPLTLPEIAHSVNLSVTYYSTIFRKQTRCSPIEFFNRLKIQHACEQLLSTSQSISEIAYSLGFEDALYFSRVFHLRIGMSPRAYREQSIKNS